MNSGAALTTSTFEFVAETAAETEARGAAIARRAEAGDRIHLSGELGAGKTTLVRGFLRELGFRDTVRSPTFTLVESYPLASFPVYHFDLYRLSRPGELEAIGFRDYFDGEAVCLVEWPERAAGLLSPPDLDIRLAFEEPGRRLLLEPHGARGMALIGQG